MTRRKSQSQSSSQSPQSPEPDADYGLYVYGEVVRRWKKVLDNGTVILNYDVSGLVVTAYNPLGEPYALGEVVRLAVQVRAYQTKMGPRYSLTLPGAVEGEF